MRSKFDHAFTADPKHRFHKRLESLGFKLGLPEVEHPDKHFCRFLAFRESFDELPVYLEFIDARDPKKPVQFPGVSFRSLGPLQKQIRPLIKRGLAPNFVHKNYEWKRDSSSRLPGWNFVTFKELGFQSLFPWITEYEPKTGGSKNRERIPVQRHPNGIRRIKAVEIDVDAEGRAFFERLLARKLTRTVRAPGGQEFYFRAASATRLRAIVLERQSRMLQFSYWDSDDAINYGGALYEEPALQNAFLLSFP
jgi:hypothetical protein